MSNKILSILKLIFLGTRFYLFIYLLFLKIN